MDETKRLTLTVPEACELLGVGRQAAYEAIRKGQLPSIRIGRLIRIPRAAVEKMLSREAA